MVPIATPGKVTVKTIQAKICQQVDSLDEVVLQYKLYEYYVMYIIYSYI